jgi:hypothetical protein
MWGYVRRSRRPILGSSGTTEDLRTLRDFKLTCPKLTPERQRDLEAARKLLEKEKSTRH